MWFVIRKDEKSTLSYCYKVWWRRFFKNPNKIVELKRELDKYCEVIIVSRPCAYPEYGPFKRVFSIKKLLAKAKLIKGE